MKNTMNSHTPTPHIGALSGEIAESILLPGDPLRAEFIAEHFLEHAVRFNQTRGMLGFTGVYQGKRVSVMGTGMGCPSIGIYTYELIHFYGVKRLIRIGTAGTLQPDIGLRDVVLAMGSCTDSNYLEQFGLPGNYSCTASYELLSRAVEAAKKQGIRYHVGNILSTDVFYKPETEKKPISWADMGVLACEMESAALYANAAYGKAEALCILTISDSPFCGTQTTAAERQSSFTDMMKLALQCV